MPYLLESIERSYITQMIYQIDANTSLSSQTKQSVNCTFLCLCYLMKYKLM